MNGSERDEVRVIRADYGRLDILINRAQCSSSVYIADTQPIDTGRPYLQNLIEVDGEPCLLFDLHRYVADSFQVKGETAARLALLCELSLFSGEGQTFLREQCFPPLAQWEPSERRIAFLFASNASVQAMTVFALAAQPRCIRSHLLDEGIIAAGFDEKKILFLLDVERLIVTGRIFAEAVKCGY